MEATAIISSTTWWLLASFQWAGWKTQQVFQPKKKSHCSSGRLYFFDGQYRPSRWLIMLIEKKREKQREITTSGYINRTASFTSQTTGRFGWPAPSPLKPNKWPFYRKQQHFSYIMYTLYTFEKWQIEKGTGLLRQSGNLSLGGSSNPVHVAAHTWEANCWRTAAAAAAAAMESPDRDRWRFLVCAKRGSNKLGCLKQHLLIYLFLYIATPHT